MRFWAAVLVSAIAQVVVLTRLEGWFATGALLAVLYLALAALGAGWFAQRRSALAGALSVALGVALAATITYLGPAGAGTPLVDLLLAILRLALAYWPYIAIGAIAGLAGGALRRRVLRAARRS